MYKESHHADMGFSSPASLPPPPPCPPSSAPHGLRSHGSSRLKTKKQNISQLMLDVPSRGSKNHLKGACKPCYYCVEGLVCPDAAKCNNCHHYHDSETIRIWRLLSQMTKEERIAFLKERQEQSHKPELKNQNKNSKKMKAHPPAKSQQQELKLGQQLCHKEANPGYWNTEDCRSVFTAASCQLADSLAEVLQVSRGFTEPGVPQWSMHPNIYRL